jgi:hypothetical protein
MEEANAKQFGTGRVRDGQFIKEKSFPATLSIATSADDIDNDNEIDTTSECERTT